MCAVPATIGRRAVLGGLLALPLVAPGAAGALASSRARRQSVAIGGGVEVVPRASWGGDLPATGPLVAEAPGDVRFLLVHHTVSPNGYAPGEVEGLLRGIYRFHTGDKGWPDVAYNFFVDAHGTVWEGRTGSLEQPVRGDATGGSQGYAQLCCFVGDHQTEPPTAAAQQSMVALLAWLAARYGIDPTPGATATFTSRGSQKWPAGASVTTPTIAGHRAMSSTVCPGDAAFVLLAEDIPRRVVAAMGATSASTAPPTTTSGEGASTTSADAATTSAPPSTDAPTTASTGATTSTAPGSTVSPSGVEGELAAATTDDGGGVDGLALGLGAAGVVAGVVGAGLLLRGRRDQDPTRA